MSRLALVVPLALITFANILGYVPILAVAVPAAAEGVQPKPLALQPSASAKAPSASDTGTHELSRADLEAFLNGFVPYALKNADIAGLTLVVVKDGQILFEKGYGDADVRTERAMDPGLTDSPGFDFKAFHLDRGHATGRTGQT
jgi:hypothetical protein